MQVWTGSAYPLGATYDGAGTNFALFTSVAEGVELCLFDEAGNEQRVALTEVDADIWHAYLPGILPGQRYGYRVHGPYDPAAGNRCNPAKLLLDPYAKAVDGQVDWDESVFAYRWDDHARRERRGLGPARAESGRGRTRTSTGPTSAHRARRTTRRSSTRRTSRA